MAAASRRMQIIRQASWLLPLIILACSAAEARGQCMACFEDSDCGGGTPYCDGNPGCCVQCLPISAPTSVTATDGTYCHKVRVIWVQVSAATGYEIYRGAVLVGTRSAPSNFYDDTGGSAGTTYSYTVKAVNDCETTAASPANSGYRIATNGSCSGGYCNASGSCVDCTLASHCDDSNACTTDTCVSDVCSNANNTNSCTSDGNACTDDVCSGGSCTHPNNTDACNDGDSCTSSDTCSGGSCSGTPCCGPSAPTSVAASNGSYCTYVRVTWSSSESSFQIWRNTTNNSGSASQIGTDTASPYNDTSASSSGTVYYYWVKATNSCGTSGFSSSNSGWRKTVPSVPGGVAASDDTYCDKVQITWNNVSNETGYTVWRHTSNSSGSSSQIGSTGVNVITYDDTTATAGTTYYYWVKSTNSCGSSGFSSSNSGRRCNPNTAPDAPSSLSPADGSSFPTLTPTLNFTQSDTDSGDTLAYRIQIDDTDNTFSSLVVDYTSGSLAQGATSYTVGAAGTYTVGSTSTTLANGKHYWRVDSDDGTATGAWSSIQNFWVGLPMPLGTCP